MGSKQKQTQAKRKEYFERRLKDRMSSLSERGTEPSDIDKDAFAKKLRANIKAINDRLKAIAALERKTEELAKRKAEKAAAPKEPEAGKEKEPKKAPEKGKGKEKAPKKAPEAGKGKEPKKTPEEGKAKKKEKEQEKVKE